MKKYSKKLQWGILFITLLAFIGGCSFFERDSPTDPIGPSIEEPLLTEPPAGVLSNFSTASSTADEFQIVSSNSRGFRFTIPKAGDFLLTYVTSSGTWHLVLRSTGKALVTTGLDGSELYSATLQEGQIRNDASPKMRTGPVSLYTWPAQSWERIFTLAGGAVPSGGTAYTVSEGNGYFDVDIPAAGDYLFTYVTNIRTFKIVLRAKANARMRISLRSGYTLRKTSLIGGKITTATGGRQHSATVTFFAWPGSGVSISSVFAASSSSKELVIAAIGNSLTYGNGRSNYPAKLLAKLRAAGYKVVVRNEGEPGEHSPRTVHRFERTIRDADIVLLMIGTNDIVSPGACSRPYDCNTLGNIEWMLDKTVSQGKIPVVSTVPPPRPTDIYAWADSNVRTLNQRIKNLAAGKSVVMVDNYQAIRDNGYDALFIDRLHFNDRGYSIIADNWYRALTRNEIL